MTEITALVPMRHQSIRVPEKNYRMLAGKPLYSYIIQTLLDCPEIGQIAVDTDSPVIKEGLIRDFPQVRIIDRPDHLRADTVPMNDILLHDCGLIQADLYLQTHSTNPLADIRQHLGCNPDIPSPGKKSTILCLRSQNCKPDYGMAMENRLNHDPGVVDSYPGFTTSI